MTRVTSTLNRRSSETDRGVDSPAPTITVLSVGDTSTRTDDDRCTPTPGEANTGVEERANERVTVSTALGESDRFTVLSESRPEAVLTRLGEIDCLLLECSTASTAVGNELVTAVTAREPTLPIVFTPREVSPRESDAEHPAVEPNGGGRGESDNDGDGGDDHIDSDRPVAVDVLEQQIRRAVEYRRATTLTRRALFAVETASEGVAIVTPTGTIEFANHAYSRQFGYDPEDLHGRSWTDVYTDDEADRLRTTAIPTVDDGWRWAGNCVGRRKDGESVTVQTEISGLEDGSLVFTIHEKDDARVRADS